MPTLHLLTKAHDALIGLPRDIQEIISAHAYLLEIGETKTLAIKTLRGPIKELIVHQYRLVFFRKNTAIYGVDIFKKQSQKTPERIIERAEKIYKITKTIA